MININMKTFKSYLNELVHFSEILTKKGESFVDKLLSQYIIVNFKIDVSAFVFGKENGELVFYGREGKIEIDKVKRAGMDLFEPFIERIEQSDWQQMPDGIRIYAEMFTGKFEPIIKHPVTPKNGLIISYSELNGKRLLPNNPINIEMAKLFDIAPPPIMFEGKLNNKQKGMIKDFLNNPEDYKQVDFTKFILGLFLPPKSVSGLIDDLIEGIVIYFDDGSMSKIVDPGFTDTVKMKKAKMNDNTYNDTLKDVIFKNIKSSYDAIMTNKTTLKKINKEKSLDDKYIRLAAALTGSLMHKVSKQFKDIDMYKDSALENRFSSVTHKMLPVGFSQMIKIKSWWAEDVFRVVLFALPREKKRVHKASGLTRERKELINNIVADLRVRGIVE